MASVCKRLAAGRAVYRDEGEEEEEELEAGSEEAGEGDGDDEELEDEEGALDGRLEEQEEQAQEPSSSVTQSPSTSSSSSTKKILIMSLLEGSKNRRQRAWAVAEPPHVVIGNPRALSRLVEQVGVFCGWFYLRCELGAVLGLGWGLEIEAVCLAPCPSFTPPLKPHTTHTIKRHSLSRIYPDLTHHHTTPPQKKLPYHRAASATTR